MSSNCLISSFVLPGDHSAQQLSRGLWWQVIVVVIEGLAEPLPPLPANLVPGPVFSGKYQRHVIASRLLCKRDERGKSKIIDWDSAQRAAYISEKRLRQFIRGRPCS